MLKLYNKEHVAISALTNLKDYKIEYLLSGEDLVEFSLSIYDENINLVEEEGYVRSKNNEYVIKAIDPSDNFKRFSCNVNVESLVGKSITNFDTSNNNITDTIRLAIAGTGWLLVDNNITKRRTVRLKNTNALEVLREIRKVFRIDFRFDAINKKIYVYESYGSDKGVYFSDELNLMSLQIPSDTYDYATRLIPKGKDGLDIKSVNGGKEYMDNFQYSNKIIEVIWEDNRYTDINSLKADAEAKLEELSKPKRSYQANVYDLAKHNNEYSYLDFFIGDTVTLLSKTEKFRDKQRIVKYIEYPKDPSKNTCELGNTMLTFEELQKENEAKNNVVDNITSNNGTVDGSKVDSITTEQISDFKASVAEITDLTVINADITNLKAQNVTITGELNVVKANIGTLAVNVATIDKLTVTHTANINDLKANSATITQLNVVSATINTLEVDVGKIQTLVNGNLSSENIQAGGITSDKLTISNGFITNAMIANLDVSKVNAGEISTSKFKIKSDDGSMEFVGATQQFKDKNNKVRIQMGKDTQGNFNFIIRGEDGTTTLIDHTGVKSKAIADNLIVDNMIASDAVGEKQINYSSFATGFNKDTNTSTIKSTKVMLNNQNQTLEVAFDSLKTQADGTKTTTESNSTTIGVMQGQITIAINNTQIVKDGQTILLKDDYNRTVSTVNSMNSTIGQHTTQINEATGKISSVETNVNTISRDMEGTKSTVSSHATQISGLNSTVSSQASDISQLKTQITLKVEQTDITNAINAEGKITDSKINSAKSEIKLTTDAIVSDLTRHQGDLNWLSSESSRIDQKANGIQTTVSAIQGDYVGQAQLTQNVSGWKYEVSQTGGYNLLRNGGFEYGFAHWLTNGNPTIEVGQNSTHYNGKSILVYTNGAYNGIFQKFDTVIGETYSYSAMIYSEGKVYLGIEGVATQDIGAGNWSRITGTFVATENNHGFVCYGRELTAYYIDDVVVTKGTIPSQFVPNEAEVYSGVTFIDAEGVKVQHESNSFSRMNSKEFYQANENGERMLSMRLGGLRTYKWEHDRTYLGGLGATRLVDAGNNYSLTMFGTGHAENLLFGFDKGYVADGQAKSVLAYMACVRDADVIRLWRNIDFNGTGIERLGNIRIRSGSTEYPHRIGNYDVGKLGLYGDNGVKLGVLEGVNAYTSIECFEYPEMGQKSAVKLWGHLDMNGRGIWNASYNYSLKPQSKQLRGKTKAINTASAPMSMCEGELRYTDRSEYLITKNILDDNLEILIEIPQILAENLELAYHINISKLGFGDYRIKEKNPYYFIIESDRENFKFTFEIVGKMIEKSYERNTVAGLEYQKVIPSEEVLVEKPPQIEMGSRYALMDDEEIEKEVAIEELRKSNKLYQIK